jgi:NAD(P)-dependent dehydrogenase (short-subunit alcohol dehydrogenase family)
MSRYKGKFALKHVVITGGSEGIGLAIASEFISAGAHVTLMARSMEKLATAQAKLRLLASDCRSGSRVWVESVDVTSFEQVRAPHAPMHTPMSGCAALPRACRSLSRMAMLPHARIDVGDPLSKRKLWPVSGYSVIRGRRQAPRRPWAMHVDVRIGGLILHPELSRGCPFCLHSPIACDSRARVLAFQVQAAMKAAQTSMGPVDIVVCNAGSSTPGGHTAPHCRMRNPCCAGSILTATACR